MALFYRDRQSKRMTKGSARLLVDVGIESRRAAPRLRYLRKKRFQNEDWLEAARARDLAALALYRWHQRHLVEVETPEDEEKRSIAKTQYPKTPRPWNPLPEKARLRRTRGRRCRIAQNADGTCRVDEYLEPEPLETEYDETKPTDLDWPRSEHEIREDAKPFEGEVVDLFAAPTRRATPDEPLPSLDEPNYRQLRINLFRFLFGDGKSKEDALARLAKDSSIFVAQREQDGQPARPNELRRGVESRARRTMSRYSVLPESRPPVLRALVEPQEAAEHRAVESLPLKQRIALRRRHLAGEEWPEIRRALGVKDERDVMKRAREGRYEIDNALRFPPYYSVSYGRQRVPEKPKAATVAALTVKSDAYGPWREYAALVLRQGAAQPKRRSTRPSRSLYADLESRWLRSFDAEPLRVRHDRRKKEKEPKLGALLLALDPLSPVWTALPSKAIESRVIEDGPWTELFFVEREEPMRNAQGREVGLRRVRVAQAAGPIVEPIESVLDRIAVELRLPVPLPGEALDRAAWKKAKERRARARRTATKRALGDQAEWISKFKPNPSSLEDVERGRLAAHTARMKAKGRERALRRLASLERAIALLRAGSPAVRLKPFPIIDDDGRFLFLLEREITSRAPVEPMTWAEIETAFPTKRRPRESNYERRPWLRRLVEVLDRGVRRLRERATRLTPAAVEEAALARRNYRIDRARRFLRRRLAWCGDDWREIARCRAVALSINACR